MNMFNNLEYQENFDKKVNYINFSQSNEVFFEKIIGDIKIGAPGNINHFILNNYEEIRKRLMKERIVCLFMEYGVSEINSNFYYDIDFLKQVYLIKMEVTYIIINSIKENLDNYAKGFLMSLMARMYELHKDYYNMLLELLEEDKKIISDLKQNNGLQPKMRQKKKEN